MKALGFIPETIQMVEAHGTGTSPWGIRLNIEALRRAFRHDTEKGSLLCTWIGENKHRSCCSSCWHCWHVLKVLLSLQHKAIPPSLNYKNGNSAIKLENSPFYVNTTLKNWTVEDE